MRTLTTINTLVNRCAELEKESDANSEQIKVLNERIETLEQYRTIDNIVISGLYTKLYSSVISNDEIAAQTGEPTRSEINNIENAVLSIFNGDLQADIKGTDVSVMHYLPMKKSNNSKNKPKDIIVRFTNRCAKNSIMRLTYTS